MTMHDAILMGLYVVLSLAAFTALSAMAWLVVVWIRATAAADRRDEEHEDDPQTPARMTGA